MSQKLQKQLRFDSRLTKCCGNGNKCLDLCPIVCVCVYFYKYIYVAVSVCVRACLAGVTYSMPCGLTAHTTNCLAHW